MQSQDRRKPRIELMGILRVAGHGHGRAGPPSPVVSLHCRTPCTPPLRSPLDVIMESTSGASDSSPLESTAT
eukprot:1142188-Pelagomonas_calceolata.AAC.1